MTKHNIGREVINTQTQPKIRNKIISFFNRVVASSSLSVQTAINDMTCTVTSSAGFNVGDMAIIFDAGINEYYLGGILSINSNVLTLDTPIDSVFPVGSSIDSTKTNMNVDGSSTPVTFGIRGASTEYNIGKSINITRIIFSCLTDGSVDLAKFGNITKLTRGVVLKRRGHKHHNIFNVKNNAEIDGITLDWKPYSATNPNQGQHGFTARLTFGGEDKLDSIERLAPDEDLEIIIQDDLTDLTVFKITVEGNMDLE